MDYKAAHSRHVAKGLHEMLDLSHNKDSLQ